MNSPEAGRIEYRRADMSSCPDSARGALIDFRSLAKSGLSNEYLVAPRGYCPGPADGGSPIFEVPVASLAAAIEAALEKEPRTRLLRADRGIGQYVYEQRSRVFRFPDVVHIQILPQGDDRSTLAIRSRSIYGRNDLGVNRRRVLRWLRAITAEVARELPAAVEYPRRKA